MNEFSSTLSVFYAIIVLGVGTVKKVLIMKRRLFTLVSVVMLGCILLSCSKNDDSSSKSESSVSKNPLAGTLWEEDDSVPLRMEFSSYGTVRVWGNYASEGTGSYTVSGNTVTFSSLSTTTSYHSELEYKSGTFTGNTILLNIKETFKGSSSNLQLRLYKK